MCKKFTHIILTLVTVMSVFTTAAAGQSFDNGRLCPLAIAEMEVSCQFDLLREGLGASDSWLIPADLLPDFYGGIHADYDGSPIIFIVESKLEEAYRHDVIGAFLEAGIEYRFVEFSYAELRAAQDTAWRIAGSRMELYGCIYSFNISAGFIDPHANRAVVGIIDDSERMIAGLRRYVYDSPMVVFQQMGPFYMGGRGVLWPSFVILSPLLLSIIAGIIVISINRIIRWLQYSDCSPDSENWGHIVIKPLCKAISILAGCMSVPVAVFTTWVFVQKMDFSRVTTWRTFYDIDFWTLIIVLALLLLVTIGAHKLGKASEAESRHLREELIELAKKIDDKQEEINLLHSKIENLRNDSRKEQPPCNSQY